MRAKVPSNLKKSDDIRWNQDLVKYFIRDGFGVGDVG